MLLTGETTMSETSNIQQLDLDYKKFSREFERYRAEHPEASLQQALDAFAAQKNAEKAPALV